MAKITVELEAFYGYSCGFQSHSSNETVELEVSDSELDALKKLGKEQITAEDIVAAIESGDTTLQSLHEKLEEKFYYMVEEYWLYEADNEFLIEYLRDSLEEDVKAKLYTPIPFDEVVKKVKSREIKFSNLKFSVDSLLEHFEEMKDIPDSLKELSECVYDWSNDPDAEYKYNRYILNHYYEWICKQDHAFAAKRIGLNLDACRDDEVDYTITIS